MTAESFPCIICGKSLERVVDWAESQPHDGIMCETGGNYGSTVFDSMDGERLAFNICDQCMVTAGKQGRVMTYRKYRLLLAPVGILGRLVVGHEDLNRPYVPWHAGLERDDESVILTLEEFRNLPKTCHLYMSLSEIEAGFNREEQMAWIEKEGTRDGTVVEERGCRTADSRDSEGTHRSRSGRP